MITSVHIIVSGEQTAVSVNWPNPKKAALLCDDAISGAVDIVIRFGKNVEAYRNHQYEWVGLGNENISAAFAPKILKLSDGTLVQASHQIGIWEIKGSELWWRFNPPGSSAITRYTEPHNGRLLQQADSRLRLEKPLCLLFPDKAVEFSRSPIPFSAIACFTDHCDFDTRDNLVLQRELFRRCGIRVTKGFFLNHFSKRADNASYERDSAELRKWEEDGHELAYHSLSQSLKTNEDSIRDFAGFEPPARIPVWIDHGYQPYNLSLYHRFLESDAAYSQTLHDKGIAVLWNYVDSGTAATGVINQLNPEHFTLSRFYAAYKSENLSSRAGRMIKNIMFHFYGEERLLFAYRQISKNFRKVVYEKKAKSAAALARNVFSVAKPLSGIAVRWNAESKKTYPLARYSPVFFRHRIADRDFWIFQTIDMVDFKQSLSRKNLDLLVEEKGLFIAHTYFSVPMSYHKGRVFETPHRIDAQVEANFADLGERIANRQIWNPTLSELLDQFCRFSEVELDISGQGKITIVKGEDLPHRDVSR